MEGKTHARVKNWWDFILKDLKEESEMAPGFFPGYLVEEYFSAVLLTGVLAALPLVLHLG